MEFHIINLSENGRAGLWKKPSGLWKKTLGDLKKNHRSSEKKPPELWKKTLITT